LQFVVLVLAITAWGQQFNSSPIQSLAQHQVTSSQDTKRSGTQKQQFRFLIVPVEQNKLSSHELNPFGSVPTFQRTRENNGVVQQRFQQPVQLKALKGTASLTTPRNSVNVAVPAPLESQSAAEGHSVQQTQNIQTLAFKPSNQTPPPMFFQISPQGFQPLSSPSAQQQLPFSIQTAQSRIAQERPDTFHFARQQAVQKTNQRTVETKSTSVSQTAKQAHMLQSNELNSHVQQPLSPIQHHLPQRTTFLRTFPTQRLSAQMQPFQQQQILGNVFSSQTENLQQEAVHDIEATQSQQHQISQKKVVQNQQRVDESTLSPEEELFQKQARNAKYSFNSAINDNIMDNTQIRQEKRNGLELSGFYSYSDGFYKRTVHYKADEHGYRVTK
jgi:hypothetical protein